MAEDKEKIVEKRYIETDTSTRKHFIVGFMGGLGWALGASIGTAIVAYALSLVIKRLDLIPFFGQFIADVIRSAQQNLQAK